MRYEDSYSKSPEDIAPDTCTDIQNEINANNIKPL